MTKYSAGDLLLLQFPQTSGAHGSLRPALVVVDTGDLDVLVARVTRQMHGTAHDVIISEWRGAGLLAPSIVRLHKLATLEKSIVQRKLGCLQAADRSAVANVLTQIFGSW
jgi:mRNA interferase MazF